MREEIGIELNLNRAFKGFNKYFVDNLNYRDKKQDLYPFPHVIKEGLGKRLVHHVLDLVEGFSLTFQPSFLDKSVLLLKKTSIFAEKDNAEPS